MTDERYVYLVTSGDPEGGEWNPFRIHAAFLDASEAVEHAHNLDCLDYVDGDCTFRLTHSVESVALSGTYTAVLPIRTTAE